MTQTALEGKSVSVPEADPSDANGRGDEQLVTIRPAHGWQALDMLELWRSRELIYFLAWRDVKVRYKQTAFGVAWAVLQPVVQMLVFSFIFGGLARLPSDGVPYPLFAFTGLIPWNFFANATNKASSSLVGNYSLISKVYFPRLAIPLSGVLAGLVDLAIGTVLIVVLLLITGTYPSPALLLLPLLALLATLTALSMGVWLSALDVHYRDVRYVVPFLVQVWMFLTPVVYPVSSVPERWRLLYALNPMTGVVEGFRWMLLGQGDAPGAMLAVSTAIVLVVLVSGLFYFRRMEQVFADVA